MDVSLIIYHGNDVHIAEEIYNYLCDCKNHDIPVPLDGTEFRIRVEDGEIQSSNDYGNYSTKYKIILKGVLI